MSAARATCEQRTGAARPIRTQACPRRHVEQTATVNKSLNPVYNFDGAFPVQRGDALEF